MEEVTVYRRCVDGKIRLIATFENIDQLIKTVHNDVELFDNDIDTRIDAQFDRVCSLRTWDRQHATGETVSGLRFAYVAFEGAKLITKDRLVGLCRAYKPTVWWWMHPTTRHPGSKRPASYRYYRRPKSTNEKRWANAWVDEEYAIKPRGKRTPHNLPDAWDDCVRADIGDRCWKRHRKTQWKEKV